MDTFVVLADPTRRRIIESLCRGECSFGDIAQRFDISRPAVSQHLKVLRDAGVVDVRRDAQRRIYRLRENGLHEVADWLTTVRGFWAGRLNQLEQVLREEDKNNE